jgi:putative ABC transport system substrate-binding protein
MVTIGVARWSSDSEFGRSVEGFKEGLAENGYMEGKNVRFIIEDPETSMDKQHEIISSFIRARVDLIYSVTTPGTIVAKELTEKMNKPIPVVFTVCTYPVESNLIASLESSGNNLVGTRNYVPFSEQFYAFERIFPNTRKLAVVRRKGEPNSTNQLEELKAFLGEQSIKVVDIAAVDLNDIRQQLEANIKSVDAIFSTCDTLTHAGGEEIIAEFSVSYKKPSFACNKGGILKGNLIGNVADFKSIGQLSGEKAALILNGASPAMLRTESPRGSYIVINTKTAAALGLAVPRELSAIAKEIVK